MIRVIVDVSVALDDRAQFAEDADRVYAEIFETLAALGCDGAQGGSRSPSRVPGGGSPSSCAGVASDPGARRHEARPG